MKSVTNAQESKNTTGCGRLAWAVCIPVLIVLLPVRSAYATSVQDDARALFEHFVEAQNTHDTDAVHSMLWNSPDFLWVSRGEQIRGASEAMEVYRSYYKGTWHLEPDMAHFRVTVITGDVAQVLVPIVFSRGLPGKEPQNATYLISQTLVRQVDGWHVATVLPIANTQLK